MLTLSQSFQEAEYLSLSKKLELPDHDVSLLEQLIDIRSDHNTIKPTSSPTRSAKQPDAESVMAKPAEVLVKPVVSLHFTENVNIASPKSNGNNNNVSSSHSTKSTVVEESSFEEADEVEEEEFEPADDEPSFEKAPAPAPSITITHQQPTPVVAEAKPVSPKSPLADLPPLKGATAKSTGPMLGALPDLKVPSRFNLTAGDVLPAPTAYTAAKVSKDDDGPEFDSEIEEEEEEPEEEEEEDFSQLDQEAPEAKHNADEKHSSGPSSRAVVVDSKASTDSNAAGAGRANVQRVDAGSRSTRGWNLPADDQQEFEDSREDDNEDSVDQTQSTSVARGPGRRTFPIRGSPQPAVPGRPRSSHDNSDALDMSSSQQLSVMEDIEDGLDNEDESHHNRGQQNGLQTSRRSNQEEEDDDDDEVDQTNDHDDDGDDKPYDLDGEDEFGDDDELPIGGYQPSSRTTAAPAAAAPAKLFTTSNNKQNESKVNASAVEEEYGEDDFEEDEVMDADEEEEIASIMEEEELSVGGQSNDDEEDWKKSSTSAPAAKKDSGSMFQQRAYAAPPASTTTASARRHDFSALNDYSDDEDDYATADSGKGSGGSSAAAATAEAKRLAEIDRQLQQMEKDDTNLRKIREDYTGNNKGKVSGVLPDTTGDEISVASDSMVESFNADED